MMTSKSHATPDNAEQVCRDLPIMLDRCMHLGMFATVRAMREVIRKARSELVEITVDEKRIAEWRRHAMNRETSRHKGPQPENFGHMSDQFIRLTLNAAPAAIGEADVRAVLSETLRAVANDVSDHHIPGPELSRRIAGVELACDAIKRGSVPEYHAALRNVWGGRRP